MTIHRVFLQSELRISGVGWALPTLKDEISDCNIIDRATCRVVAEGEA